jgi:hypothetical protein
MSIQTLLIGDRIPVFDFKFPLPKKRVDYLEFMYDKMKLGSTLYLKVKIIYFLADARTKEKYEVTQFSSVYEISPDGERLTIEALYPACGYATDVLVFHLWAVMESCGQPRLKVSCPHIQHLRRELRRVINWYNSH